MSAALPRFRKARQLNPTDPRAALYLGLTAESLGQTAEALSLYEEAVRLERDRNELQAETLLPGIRLLLLLGRVAECERWLAQALKLSPNSRDVHFEWARCLLEKGDAERAATEGEAALRLSQGIVTDSAIRYLLIRAYQKCVECRIVPPRARGDHARTRERGSSRIDSTPEALTGASRQNTRR